MTHRRAFLFVCVLVNLIVFTALVRNRFVYVDKLKVYGFTTVVQIKGAGVEVRVPAGTDVFTLKEHVYAAENGHDDFVTFEVIEDTGDDVKSLLHQQHEQYDTYRLDSFRGYNHSGYIAHALSPGFNNWAGEYVYVTRVAPTKLLIVLAPNEVQSKSGIFFGGDLEKFKSFIYGMKRIPFQEISLEDNSDDKVYRSGDTSIVFWKDPQLGLKIVGPEWTESREADWRDLEGKLRFSDWQRVQTTIRIVDDVNKKTIELSAGHGGGYLSILSDKYAGLSFSSVVQNLLLPAGFCAEEWEKNSQNGSYTRDDVVKNLILKTETTIGDVQAQLRGIQADFSEAHDCRGGDVWLLRGKNGRYMTSSISPNGTPFTLESYP